MDFRTASIAGALALTFSTSSFALDLQPYTTKGAPVGKTFLVLVALVRMRAQPMKTQPPFA